MFKDKNTLAKEYESRLNKLPHAYLSKLLSTIMVEYDQLSEQLSPCIVELTNEAKRKGLLRSHISETINNKK